MDIVRIASVQTRVQTGEGSCEKNIAYAYNVLDEASKNNADIICFPETFPGPTRRQIKFDPFDAMSSKARQIGKYVVYGTLEDAPEAHGKHHIVEVLVGPDGKMVGKYCRTCPPEPWLYANGSFWDVDYTPCNELPVFETELGKIGLLVCSEVYVPELCRVLALKDQL